jgi:hypothetical protein
MVDKPYGWNKFHLTYKFFYLRTETDPVSETLFFVLFLDKIGTMDIVQNLSFN